MTSTQDILNPNQAHVLATLRKLGGSATRKDICTAGAISAYMDKHPPMGESIWAVRQIREAVAAIVGPVQKVPENCGSGHCSCIECFKDKP